MPTIGQPYLTAMSITLQTFSAKTSLNEPPKIVEVLREDEHRAAEDGAVSR